MDGDTTKTPQEVTPGASANPFAVTKAVDFTDAQIDATWVDLPDGGFEVLVNPCSPMPMIVTGGKGGGRTHLLRHFSYPLQRIRHPDNLVAGLYEEGYIGVFFRFSGLNSSRMVGKGQDKDVWSSVFSYATELWFGSLVLELIWEFYDSNPAALQGDEIRAFVSEVRNIFDAQLPAGPEGRGGSNPLTALIENIKLVRRDLDLAINNAGLSRQLDVQILATPGNLVFGVPQAATRHLSAFSGLVFTYLLDEFENLTEHQQRYVNTLLREKQLPTTFIIGTRSWGFRTQSTLSAGETNKKGSEFDLVVLEDAYIDGSKRYRGFCLDIVYRRLRNHGYRVSRKSLQEYFETPEGNLGRLEEQAAHYLAENGVDQGPWLERLRRQLVEYRPNDDADSILDLVRVPGSPLHEKLSVLLTYRAWYHGKNLLEAAQRSHALVADLIEGRETKGGIATTYAHYKRDLFAQIVDALKLQQQYYGFDDMVRLSGYLPRNLLVLLKEITRWSQFLGEEPYVRTPVSIKAQRQGILAAGRWFLREGRGLGTIGEYVQVAIPRLAELFRDMRFSDKPAEVSCATFDMTTQGVSPAAVEVHNHALVHSLILEIPGGRRDRNSGILRRKYRLHPLLCPLFDLSIAVRGSVTLSAEELNTIFDPSVDEAAFRRATAPRLSRLNAPFAVEAASGQPDYDPQATLDLD